MDFGLNGITAFLLGISTQLILVYALFYQWFCFSAQTTLLVVAALKTMELCANEIVTDETRWILAILATLQTPLLIPLMKKGMRRLMLIIYMIYASIYNAFGGIVISAMTTVYGILAGKSNQTWFIGATMTQADFVLKWTGAILCYAAAILICRKCILLLEYLSEREKCFFTGVHHYGCCRNDDYSNFCNKFRGYAGRFFGCRIRNLYYWAGAFNYAGICAAANSAAARKSQAANTDAGTIRVLSKCTRNTAPAA